MLEIHQITELLSAIIVFLLIIVVILSKTAYFWKNKYNVFYSTQSNDVWGRRWIYYSTKTQEKWITHRQDISTHIRRFLQQNPEKYGVFTMTVVNISSIDVDITVDVYDDIEPE